MSFRTTAELLPCEMDASDQDLRRRVEIETLQKASQMILEISPEAARVLRDASRLMLRQMISDIQRQVHG